MYKDTNKKNKRRINKSNILERKEFTLPTKRKYHNHKLHRYRYIIICATAILLFCSTVGIVTLRANGKHKEAIRFTDQNEIVNDKYMDGIKDIELEAVDYVRPTTIPNRNEDNASIGKDSNVKNDNTLETDNLIDESSKKDEPMDAGKNNSATDTSASDQKNPSSVVDSTIDTSDSENSEETTEENVDEPKEGLYKGKNIYLTFDDGPSIHTGDILDILNFYGVKATFFVIGLEDDHSKAMYKRIVEEGHSLGIHSYSHNYKEIYNSIAEFEKDFTKLADLLYDITGYTPDIYRFPGGSSNKVSKLKMEKFVKYLNGNKIPYYDWNVDSGDALGSNLPVETLLENIMRDLGKRQNSMVLMHDVKTKYTTVELLPKLIEHIMEEEGNIIPITKDVEPIQHIKSSTVQ